MTYLGGPIFSFSQHCECMESKWVVFSFTFSCFSGCPHRLQTTRLWCFTFTSELIFIFSCKYSCSFFIFRYHIQSYLLKLFSFFFFPRCVLTPGDPYMPLPNDEIIKRVSKQVGSFYNTPCYCVSGSFFSLKSKLHYMLESYKLALKLPGPRFLVWFGLVLLCWTLHGP